MGYIGTQSEWEQPSWGTEALRVNGNSPHGVGDTEALRVNGNSPHGVGDTEALRVNGNSPHGVHRHSE